VRVNPDAMPIAASTLFTTGAPSARYITWPVFTRPAAHSQAGLQMGGLNMSAVSVGAAGTTFTTSTTATLRNAGMAALKAKSAEYGRLREHVEERLADRMANLQLEAKKQNANIKPIESVYSLHADGVATMPKAPISGVRVVDGKVTKLVQDSAEVERLANAQKLASLSEGQLEAEMLSRSAKLKAGKPSRFAGTSGGSEVGSLNSFVTKVGASASQAGTDSTTGTLPVEGAVDASAPAAQSAVGSVLGKRAATTEDGFPMPAWAEAIADEYEGMDKKVLYAEIDKVDKMSKSDAGKKRILTALLAEDE